MLENKVDFLKKEIDASRPYIAHPLQIEQCGLQPSIQNETEWTVVLKHCPLPNQE